MTNIKNAAGVLEHDNGKTKNHSLTIPQAPEDCKPRLCPCCGEPAEYLEDEMLGAPCVRILCHKCFTHTVLIIDHLSPDRWAYYYGDGRGV